LNLGLHTLFPILDAQSPGVSPDMPHEDMHEMPGTMVWREVIVLRHSMHNEHNMGGMKRRMML
jgi:hypothetical protein